MAKPSVALAKDGSMSGTILGLLVECVMLSMAEEV
jgi:hypothetical protein